MPVNSCTLCGFRQERQRELQLGSGCAGHDARLRGHDDAVCPVYMLLHRIRSGHRVRLPDLHQDEHWRGRHRQILLSLLGACLFIIRASIVLPAFFGYRI